MAGADISLANTSHRRVHTSPPDALQWWRATLDVESTAYPLGKRQARNDPSPFICNLGQSGYCLRRTPAILTSPSLVSLGCRLPSCLRMPTKDFCKTPKQIDANATGS